MAEPNIDNVPVNAGGFPLNRIVAFLGPYISIASGVAASWLLVHMHFLGLFHVQQDGLAQAIAQGAVLLLTAGLTWVGQHKWLDGWQQWEQMLLGLAAPVVAADAGPHPDGASYDPAEFTPEGVPKDARA